MASPVWTVLTILHPASIWPYHAIPHNTISAYLTTLAYHRTQCNTKSHHSIPPHAISHQLFLNPPCVWPLFLCLCVLWPHFNWTFLSFANKRLHNRSYVIASMVFTSGINPGFISNFLSPLQSKAKLNIWIYCNLASTFKSDDSLSSTPGFVYTLLLPRPSNWGFFIFQESDLWNVQKRARFAFWR